MYDYTDLCLLASLVHASSSATTSFWSFVSYCRDMRAPASSLNTLLYSLVIPSTDTAGQMR